MDGALAPVARNLFRTAFAVFLVTIVIGIFNGLNLWDPPHNWLLTHVHAGTLGWITLAVVGASLLAFEDGADARVVAGGRRMGLAVLVTVALYVIAFMIGTGIHRPIAGTLALAAIVWFLAWVWGRYGKVERTSARLAFLLASISLTLGAVLGVLLGLFIANGSLPGLSVETASSLAGAHPPAMLIGYLILAGVAITGWLLGGPNTRLSRVVPWALFGSGLLVNVAVIIDNDGLIQVSTLLEVIGIILFIVLMWSRITSWVGRGSLNFAQMAVVFLAVGMVLFVYVVSLFVSGQLDPETGTGPVGVLTAFDHAMFIGVMTNALLAVIAATAGEQVLRWWSLWALNGSLLLFLLGLTFDVAVLKQIGAPLMGLFLLHAIFTVLPRLGARPTTA